MILLDGQSGSVDLALYEPLRSLLAPCPACRSTVSPLRKAGVQSGPAACQICKDTGRQVTKLGSGDVWFNGWHVDGEPQSIGIEVCSLSDLMQKMNDGRLHGEVKGQLPRLARDYDRPYLLYYGHYRPDRDGGLQPGRRGTHNRPDRETVFYGEAYAARPYAWLEGFLSGPSFASLGIERVRVQSIEEAAWWVAVLYTQWTKEPAEHSALRKIERHKPTKPPAMDEALYRRLCWAHEFPNFNYARALAVAKAFPTVRAMVNADAEEIAAVVVETKGGEGRRVRIGKALAEAAVRAVS